VVHILVVPVAKHALKYTNENNHERTLSNSKRIKPMRERATSMLKTQTLSLNAKGGAFYPLHDDGGFDEGRAHTAPPGQGNVPLLGILRTGSSEISKSAATTNNKGEPTVIQAELRIYLNFAFKCTRGPRTRANKGSAE